MKEIARFKMGSSYFFSGFKEYKQKDNDILLIMDKWNLPKTNVLNLKDVNGDDVFFYKNMSKEDFIQDSIKSNVPMKCGKFLIKEFNEFINFTIDDLKKIEYMFHNMDEKHKYEEKIANYFIQNNSFELTDEQLKNCFVEYCLSHK